MVERQKKCLCDQKLQWTFAHTLALDPPHDKGKILGQMAPSTDDLQVSCKYEGNVFGGLELNSDAQNL